METNIRTIEEKKIGTNIRTIEKKMGTNK